MLLTSRCIMCCSRSYIYLYVIYIHISRHRKENKYNHRQTLHFEAILFDTRASSVIYL